jgi:tetratricopeptide (TPR) repeat protein
MCSVQHYGWWSIMAAPLLTFAVPADPVLAQSTIVAGRGGVMVQGRGQAAAGTFDEHGFRGIVVGPDGKVRAVERKAVQDNPFLVPKRAGHPAAPRPGAMAGAAAGNAVPPRGTFDPFDFVFGRPGGFSGAWASDEPPAELVAARRLFRLGQYDDALKSADQAEKTWPADPEIEQVRGLILFAQQKYDEAAAPAYSVLQARMAWDWTMLRDWYPSRDTYIQQLRALQERAERVDATAAAHFLLAYHCIMLDQVDTARRELIKVRSLQPDNRLVNELLDELPPSVARP